MSKSKTREPALVRKRSRIHAKGDRQLLAMSIPAMLKLLIFSYLPMIGIIMAFEDYLPRRGIFGSEFVGLKNFEFFFKSDDAFRVTRNTILMNLIFIVTGLMVALALALLMSEIRSRFILKLVQTLMFLPYFISWTIGGILMTTFLDTNGLITQAIAQLTGTKINFYASPQYWWIILPIMNIWKSAGVSSIIYYANILSIDKSLYEAAAIDGASRLQSTIHITLPQLKTMMIVMTIMNLGNVIRADFGIFYFGTRNSSLLYPVTDVIDTYVFRALNSLGDFSMAAAVGLFQSIVGCILVVSANMVVRRINRQAALF